MNESTTEKADAVRRYVTVTNLLMLHAGSLGYLEYEELFAIGRFINAASNPHETTMDDSITKEMGDEG